MAKHISITDKCKGVPVLNEVQHHEDVSCT